jgi:hypothetical protein
MVSEVKIHVNVDRINSVNKTLRSRSVIRLRLQVSLQP